MLSGRAGAACRICPDIGGWWRRARRRVCTLFRPEPFTILEELLRVARVATMRAAAAGCKLM